MSNGWRPLRPPTRPPAGKDCHAPFKHISDSRRLDVRDLVPGPRHRYRLLRNARSGAACSGGHLVRRAKPVPHTGRCVCGRRACYRVQHEPQSAIGNRFQTRSAQATAPVLFSDVENLDVNQGKHLALRRGREPGVQQHGDCRRTRTAKIKPAFCRRRHIELNFTATARLRATGQRWCTRSLAPVMFGAVRSGGRPCYSNA